MDRPSGRDGAGGSSVGFELARHLEAPLDWLASAPMLRRGCGAKAAGAGGGGALLEHPRAPGRTAPRPLWGPGRRGPQWSLGAPDHQKIKIISKNKKII